MMDFKNKTDADENEDALRERAEAALIEQQRKDLLNEQERMRSWIEDDEPLPVKMACKLSRHIVAKSDADD
ncbi:MAG: hypothetical protein A2074_01670 [Candidatus Aquicultor primus]|uniref:Uncharacterized protein n=1 Tax=Candidatus Aquicultor primus TaxID=1797195 RepID=A0A1F2UR14_9ACTN|nr:MAG: hypothetical protein A2074_01670 [Candidatus Aquicultor primus]HCG99971.1 hypothetical protein [Actinomycetota bacterium]